VATSHYAPAATRDASTVNHYTMNPHDQRTERNFSLAETSSASNVLGSQSWHRSTQRQRGPVNLTDPARQQFEYCAVQAHPHQYSASGLPLYNKVLRESRYAIRESL
jgi:hypothetical protein